MKLTHIIPDGYEEPGYILEQLGLHPEVRFVYRPMLADARDTLARASSGKQPSEYYKILSAAMASRIVSWSVAGMDGKPLPVNAATALTLRPRLFDRLYSIICGDSPSDIDPKASPQAKNEEAEAALQAAIDGRPVAQIKQEADAKNS
jgi:hypothetical protein